MLAAIGAPNSRKARPHARQISAPQKLVQLRRHRPAYGAEQARQYGYYVHLTAADEARGEGLGLAKRMLARPTTERLLWHCGAHTAELRSAR